MVRPCRLVTDNLLRIRTGQTLRRGLHCCRRLRCAPPRSAAAASGSDGI